MIAELQTWLADSSFKPDRNRFDALRSAFEKVVSDARSQAESNAESESNSSEGQDVELEKLQEEFNSLVKQYNAIKREIEKKREAEAESNLRERQALIEELQRIIRDEENVDKAYKRFNAIKQKWAEIGPVAPDKRREIQADYSKLIEQFYYHISIYRELQLNDLKKNLELKTELIKKIEALENEKSVHQLDFLIHQYLQEWDTLGPTFKEEWDKIRDSYRTAVNQVFERINEHRKAVKNEHHENQVRKTALLESVRQLAEGLDAEGADVASAVKVATELQAEWRKIGFAGKKINDDLWAQFKAHTDLIFKRRKELNAQLAQAAQATRAVKKDLIEKAKQAVLLEKRKAIAEIKQLQQTWKTSEKLPGAEDFRLFREFRAICDGFFTKLKADDEKATAAHTAHQEKLKSIIEKTAALSEGGADALSAAEAEWHAEHGPSDSRLDARFKQALQQKQKDFGITPQSIDSHRFEKQLSNIAAGEVDEAAAKREIEHLVRRIKESQASTLALEDKLAFFTYAKNDNPLKKELLSRIAAATAETDAWKARRKQLELALKSARKAESVEKVE